MPNTQPKSQPSPKKPICIDDMTNEQFEAEIAKGIESIKNGHYHTLDEVKKEFGL